MPSGTCYPAEVTTWLISSVDELKNSGAARNIEEAAEALAAEFAQKAGRQVAPKTLVSLYHYHRTKNRKHAQTAPGRGEEVQSAGYLIIIPSRNGHPDEYRFLKSPTEAQNALEEIVRANRGFFPEGLKLFGEIVVEPSVSVTFKHRGLSSWSPGRIAPDEIKVRAG